MPWPSTHLRRSISAALSLLFALGCSDGDDAASGNAAGAGAGTGTGTGASGSGAGATSGGGGDGGAGAGVGGGGGSANGGTGAGGGGGAALGDFDTSEYRQNTYGLPDHYCDATRALSDDGAGTLANPWNLAQCAANPVAGDVVEVGLLPSGEGAIELPTTADDDIPAFLPANSGTPEQRIVYVTKYAAVALPDLWNDPNRTELRTNATAPMIVNGLGVADGCATYGTASRDYITFDGLAVDMQRAWIADDTGMITARSSTGTHFKNFVLRGADTTCGSNCVMYRPNDAVETVLSNFKAYDFHNDPTGSQTPQGALFSDQYGDRNSLIEHFEITNTQRGIFYKGTAPPGGNFNYGTIRYGIVRDVEQCFRFNDFDADPAHLTTVHHNLCDAYLYSGLGLTSETSDPRNVLIHNNTIANGAASTANFSGPIYIRQAATMSNVVLRDNLLDFLDAGWGHGVDAGELNGPFPTMDYNGYYKAGASLTWAYNGAESSSLGAWIAATGSETNSTVLGSEPFHDRAAGDYSIEPGHPAGAASSTGAPLGAFDGTGTVGVVTD